MQQKELKMKLPETRNELIDMNNAIRAKHSKAGSKLSDLSNTELTIYIAGETLNHGRSFEGSMDNAKLHMEDRTKAEKLFGTTDTGV